MTEHLESFLHYESKVDEIFSLLRLERSRLPTGPTLATQFSIRVEMSGLVNRSTELGGDENTRGSLPQRTPRTTFDMIAVHSQLFRIVCSVRAPTDGV